MTVYKVFAHTPRNETVLTSLYESREEAERVFIELQQCGLYEYVDVTEKTEVVIRRWPEREAVSP